QHPVMQPVMAQAPERFDGMPGQEQLLHLVEDPRRWQVMNQRRERGDRHRGLLFDPETELRGKPHAAKHADRILAVAGHRIADQPQLLRLDVGDSADGSKYNALIVKSRRTASSAWFPKTLSVSSRPCSSAVSSPACRPRKVET